MTSQILVLRFGGNLKCNFGKCIFIQEITLLMIFSLLFIVIWYISISFSQEEPIQDFYFLHLLRIRSLTLYL